MAFNFHDSIPFHSLHRFGVLFCPLLPAIGFVKSVFLFYCRVFSVYYFNKSPRTLFRVASTKNFYMALLLLTVFLCSFPVAYAMVEMVPSHACGPFRYGSVTFLKHNIIHVYATTMTQVRLHDIYH